MIKEYEKETSIHKSNKKTNQGRLFLSQLNTSADG